MAQTPQRNAVLICFAPRAQSFALWGDRGVHGKRSCDYGQALASGIYPRLRAGRFAEPVVETVHDVGEMLGQHFPRGPAGQNYLRNTPVRDRRDHAAQS